MPLPYLQKILLSLRRAELVEAKRGYVGGFRLARPPAEIMLFEVIEAVEPGSLGSKCLYGTHPCSEENACSVHELWREVRARVETFLRQTSVAVVAASDWPERLTPIGSLRPSLAQRSVPGSATRSSDHASQSAGGT